MIQRTLPIGFDTGQKLHLRGSSEKIREKKNDIVKSNENLKQIHQIAEIYSTEKEQRAPELKEVIYRNEIAGHKEDLEILKREFAKPSAHQDKQFSKAAGDVAQLFGMLIGFV